MGRAPRALRSCWRRHLRPKAFARLLGSREADLYRKTSVWLRVGGDGGVVRGGDSLDDGEPEAVPVGVLGSGAAESLEGLEQPLYLIDRDHRAAVGDGHEGVLVADPGGDLDMPAGGVVVDRVVDQVRDQPLGQRGVSGGGRRVERGGDRDLSWSASGQGARSTAVGEDGEVDRFVVVESALRWWRASAAPRSGVAVGRWRRVAPGTCHRNDSIVGFGSASATSTSDRSQLSGVRSSWEALATKCC